jgi:hypothetical protein
MLKHFEHFIAWGGQRGHIRAHESPCHQQCLIVNYDTVTTYATVDIHQITLRNFIANSNLPIYGWKSRTSIDNTPLYSNLRIYVLPTVKKDHIFRLDICILIQYFLLTLISSITDQLSSMLVIFQTWFHIMI